MRLLTLTIDLAQAPPLGAFFKANAALVLPALVLIAWTLLVLLVMGVVRVGAMKRHRISPETGRHTSQLAEKLPPRIRSVSDNYNHLHEQPTLFYALVAMLALTGAVSTVTVALAWAYVGLRIVHSLVQMSSAPVSTRFYVFLAGSIVLIAMVAIAALRLMDLMRAPITV